MKAAGTFDAARSQAARAVADARKALDDWQAANGVRSIIEGWIPSAHKGIGAWQPVDDAPTVLTEACVSALPPVRRSDRRPPTTPPAGRSTSGCCRRWRRTSASAASPASTIAPPTRSAASSATTTAAAHGGGSTLASPDCDGAFDLERVDTAVPARLAVRPVGHRQPAGDDPDAEPGGTGGAGTGAAGRTLLAGPGRAAAVPASADRRQGGDWRLDGRRPDLLLRNPADHHHRLFRC